MPGPGHDGGSEPRPGSSRRRALDPETLFEAPPLRRLAEDLRDGRLTAGDLLDRALAAHAGADPRPGAYVLLDEEGAREEAARADRLLRADPERAGPMCGIPVSVKDLYGMDGLPTRAGSPRTLPDRWSRDGWLVARLRAQGAVFVGKTHTVEFAYGALGINPHHGTPRNPRDRELHRIPGGSSAGAGVSLVEGSALVALGSDTGGSIRIPASMTGTVGLRSTTGRWPTDGVVPLSRTLDTVGALTRTVEDQAWLFGAVDPAQGDPAGLLDGLTTATAGPAGPRIALPDCAVWDEVRPGLRPGLERALDRLAGAGWERREVDGSLVDRAEALYMEGVIAGAECRAFLAGELPEWLDLLHPIVGERLARAPSPDSPAYADARARRDALAAEAAALFDDPPPFGIDLVVLPTHLLTPPPVAELEASLERYLEVNALALRPTAPASILGLPAITLPVGTDDEGMPVGLQLLARAGQDERLLAWALAAERILGRPPHGLASTGSDP